MIMVVVVVMMIMVMMTVLQIMMRMRKSRMRRIVIGAPFDSARPSIAQVADVTQQLAILEEENTLLRNLGLSASLKGAGDVAVADALDDKDEAIAVLTQRARELEKKLEAMSADMDNAMGQLSVTVLRARHLPASASASAGDDRACDPYVSVKVDKQTYKTQVFL